MDGAEAKTCLARKERAACTVMGMDRGVSRRASTGTNERTRTTHPTDNVREAIEGPQKNAPRRSQVESVE